MPVTYTQAPQDVCLFVQKRVNAHYQPLHSAGVAIDILMASGGLKHGGYPANATIKATSLDQRVAGLGDVLLKIAAEWWEENKTPEREALIDHELEHVVLCHDKDTGELLVDDSGRPKIRMKKHDLHYGGFTCIAERHKKASQEIKFAETVHQQWIQGVLFG